MDYGAMHHKRFGIPKVPGKQRPCLAPPPTAEMELTKVGLVTCQGRLLYNGCFSSGRARPVYQRGKSRLSCIGRLFATFGPV